MEMKTIMKHFVILSIALFALLSPSCKKKNGTVSTTVGTYKGVVIQNICCQIVIQTIGPDYLGQDSWIDSGTTDHHVFYHVLKVANPCQFGNHMQGDTISFKVIAQQPQNCACCMMYAATPVTAYPVEVIN